MPDTNNGITRRSALAVLAMTATAIPARATVALKAWRNPGCGCCEKWVEHMRAAGFDVVMQDDPDLAARRANLGVPEELAGCHTAIIGDYVIEGHVPPDDVILFLAEKPQALGLSVPGMPVGSPGMESDGQTEPYDVIAFARDGTRRVFARY
jgi:hypothetical protein